MKHHSNNNDAKLEEKKCVWESMAHKHALKRFHFYQPTSRKQPFWTMLNPTGSGNQSEYQKQFDVKLPRWFYVEFWNRVEWAAISETGCTKQSSVVALTLHAAHFWTFSKRNACWHRRRNRLKEAVGVDEASCDTWRCLVHPVPLIITRDTRFLNSKWIPRGFSTPMPDFRLLSWFLLHAEQNMVGQDMFRLD